MSHEDIASNKRKRVYSVLDAHIRSYFVGHKINHIPLTDGKIRQVLPRLSFLEIQPGPIGQLWWYISYGAWEIIHDDLRPIEFVLAAPEQSSRQVQLLGHLAYYNSFSKGRLDIGHTVPIGESWLQGSPCVHLLISHPYPLGRRFENCATEDFNIRLLWALPITEGERMFKIKNGLEALEKIFAQHKLKYWASDRQTLIPAFDG